MVNEASDDTVEIYQTGHVVMVLHIGICSRLSGLLVDARLQMGQVLS